MDADRFDALARTLNETPSRRGALRLLTGSALASVLGGLGALPAAAKKSKRPKKNGYGCLDVGQKCRGKDSKCCSGICQGKKPKKGERDKSKCVAHNTGGCALDRDVCFNPQLSPCSKTAFCLTTTGNAPFCGQATGGPETFCRTCRTDKDCEAAGVGLGAACVVLRTQGYCLNGCEGINGSSGTACLAPGA
jgi:hypothetical protein